jgi:uncharacterized protein YjbI with pentapeptide repeats
MAQDEVEGEAPEPPKIKASPWYLLATLYGVPTWEDDLLSKKNRIAWNRYFASNLNEEERAKLIEAKRHKAEELTTFTPEELQEVAAAFAKRCKAAAKKLTLPAGDDNIEFSHVEFEQALFEGYLFNRTSFFISAAFSGGANFDGAAFSGWAFFDSAAFSSGANFNGATFSSRASFDRATFSSRASFDRATFSEEAHFDGATFSGGTDFGGATFSGLTLFSDATFSGVAHFRGAKFLKTSSFVNAKMKGKTSFEGVKFLAEPPEFFNAKLHQGTVWRGIDWPKPKDAKKAGIFLDAYACLKLEMDRQKKHEDELDFFALELQSRRVLLGPWRGWPIWLYGILSNYGRSYARPFLWLLAVVAIGPLLLLFSDALPAENSVGFSAANTLNVFGFRKDFIDPSVIAHLPDWLEVMSAVQTILGTILLFLFGLGVRNKFRMK